MELYSNSPYAFIVCTGRILPSVVVVKVFDSVNAKFGIISTEYFKNPKITFDALRNEYVGGLLYGVHTFPELAVFRS